MILSTFPCRTVYADVYRRDGVHVGYDVIEDTWGAWTLRCVLDVGVTRRTEPIKADFPDRETAEAHCLALVEAHTPKARPLALATQEA